MKSCSKPEFTKPSTKSKTARKVWRLPITKLKVKTVKVILTPPAFSPTVWWMTWWEIGLCRTCLPAAWMLVWRREVLTRLRTTTLKFLKKIAASPMMSLALKGQTAASLNRSQQRQRTVVLIPLKRYGHPERDHEEGHLVMLRLCTLWENAAVSKQVDWRTTGQTSAKGRKAPVKVHRREHPLKWAPHQATFWWSEVHLPSRN